MQGSAKRSTNTMQKLPSQFQLGEFVKLEISKDNILRNGQISKIHFSPSKVLYDLDFKVIELEGKSYSTRIHNVDSAFVKHESKVTRSIPDEDGGF